MATQRFAAMEQSLLKKQPSPMATTAALFYMMEKPRRHVTFLPIFRLPP